jgi:hypothetical protein
MTLKKMLSASNPLHTFGQLIPWWTWGGLGVQYLPSLQRPWVQPLALGGGKKKEKNHSLG